MCHRGEPGNCNIDPEEMVGFMKACVRTMLALDVMPQPPSDKVLRVVVEKLFASADANGDGMLQPSEFYE